MGELNHQDKQGDAPTFETMVMGTIYCKQNIVDQRSICAAQDIVNLIINLFTVIESTLM